MSDTRWLIVRRSRTIPGGYRVVRDLGRVSEETARGVAARYARRHEAMPYEDLIALRTAALAPLPKNTTEPGGSNLPRRTPPGSEGDERT